MAAMRLAANWLLKGWSLGWATHGAMLVLARHRARLYSRGLPLGDRPPSIAGCSVASPPAGSSQQAGCEGRHWLMASCSPACLARHRCCMFSLLSRAASSTTSCSGDMLGVMRWRHLRGIAALAALLRRVPARQWRDLPAPGLRRSARPRHWLRTGWLAIYGFADRSKSLLMIRFASLKGLASSCRSRAAGRPRTRLAPSPSSSPRTFLPPGLCSRYRSHPPPDCPPPPAGAGPPGAAPAPPPPWPPRPRRGGGAPPPPSSSPPQQPLTIASRTIRLSVCSRADRPTLSPRCYHIDSHAEPRPTWC